MSQALPKEPTESFPYRIEHEAGSGAMGVVYRAVEPLLDRPVAIKVLKTDEGKESETHQRFLQEARAAAGLSHPGVTTVFRVGELGGSPYLVMEWLEGRTLEELIDERGPLPFEEASWLMLELLDVLGEAHRAGVVHRDLKPSNLVVLANGRLKVMDFGIALLQGRKLVETMIGTVLATPQFASPEQLQGETLDGRSDLFSASLLFYYLLSGTLPFPAKQLGELLSAVITGAPRPIHEVRQGLGAEVQAFLDRGLAKAPENRFVDADAMAEALRRLQPAAVGSGSVNLQAATTRMIAPPGRIVDRSDASSPFHAVRHILETWPSRDHGLQSTRQTLGRLLEKPFHAAAFAGAAQFGDVCLLIADGVIQGAFHKDDGTFDPDAELPDEAPLTIFTAPADEAPTVPVLAGLLSPGPPVHEGLDTELVNLPGLVGRQLDEGFVGHMHLQGDGASAFLLFADGHCRLAFVSGAWSSVEPGGWADWLGSVRARASVFAHEARPPASWYRLGYGNVELTVRAVGAEGAEPIRGTGALESIVDTAAHRAGMRFFQLQQESGPSEISGTHLEQAPARKILGWMFDQLPYELKERKKTAAWKYLGDWLMEARKVRLYTELERPGSGLKDAFDLVTEDDGGKVLHLAQRFHTLDGETLRSFVERVTTAKEARIAGGDVGGVLVISPHIEPSAEEAYRELLHQGLGNRLFAIDKSMGYEGFVRLSARRGFHLLMVDEEAGGFRPRFGV